MRFEIELKTNKISIAYQMQIVSMIKEALKNIDEEYYKELYLFDETRKNKKIKDFAFSVYFKDFELKDDIIKVNDKIILTITSNNDLFMIKLYNALVSKKHYVYKEFTLDVDKIIMKEEKQINQDSAIFTTLSPLCLISKDKNFLEVDDDEFEDSLNYICNLIVNNSCNRNLKKRLKFTNLDMKRVIVKEEIKNFSEITNRKYLCTKGMKGVFKLEGDKEDLNILYKCGLGFRRSQGFGVVNLV